MLVWAWSGAALSMRAITTAAARRIMSVLLRCSAAALPRGTQRTTTVRYESRYSVTILTASDGETRRKPAQIALLWKEEQKVHRLTVAAGQFVQWAGAGSLPVSAATRCSN